MNTDLENLKEKFKNKYNDNLIEFVFWIYENVKCKNDLEQIEDDLIDESIKLDNLPLSVRIFIEHEESFSVDFSFSFDYTKAEFEADVINILEKYEGYEVNVFNELINKSLDTKFKIEKTIEELEKIKNVATEKFGLEFFI